MVPPIPLPVLVIFLGLGVGLVALVLHARRQYLLRTGSLDEHAPHLSQSQSLKLQATSNGHTAIPHASSQQHAIIHVSGWWFIAWWWVPFIMRVIAIGPKQAWREARKMIRVMYEHRDVPAPSTEIEIEEVVEAEEEEGVVAHTPIAANSVIYAEEKEEPEEDTHENNTHSHSSSAYVDALKPGTGNGAFDFVGMLKQDPGAFLVVMRGIVFTIDLLYRAEIKDCVSRDMLTRNQNKDSETTFLRKLAATNYNYLIGSWESNEGLLRSTGIITIETRNDGEPTGRSLWPYATVEEAWAKLEPQLLEYIEKNKDQLTVRSA